MHFASEDEIDRLWAQFENGSLPKAQWTHPAHLAIAAILTWSDPQHALARMREGILFLNHRQGTADTPTSGYHETLTVFWMKIVATYCAARPDDSRLSVLNALILDLPSDLFKQYYGFDLFKSPEARAAYIPPDLQPHVQQ